MFWLVMACLINNQFFLCVDTTCVGPRSARSRQTTLRIGMSKVASVRDGYVVDWWWKYGALFLCSACSAVAPSNSVLALLTQ